MQIKYILSCLIVGLLLSTFTNELLAQKHLPFQEDNFLGSYRIAVCYDKTTHLIFPYPIVYVDLGSADLIAEKVEKVENILKLKANVENFSPTNLTVLTGSGKYFSFIVAYAASPKELNIVLRENAPQTASARDTSPLSPAPAINDVMTSTEAIALFENTGFNQAQMDKLSRSVVGKQKSIRHARTAKYDMLFALNGLYIKDDVFFYHLHTENTSNISYDIDFIRFFIRDKKVNKRTANQEIEIYPLHVYNAHLNTIAGQGSLDQVFVMEKLTIPDDKVLKIELFEKKGGRHVSFQLTNKTILKARLLP